jgi:hypothetical protein
MDLAKRHNAASCETHSAALFTCLLNSVHFKLVSEQPSSRPWLNVHPRSLQATHAAWATLAEKCVIQHQAEQHPGYEAPQHPQVPPWRLCNAGADHPGTMLTSLGQAWHHDCCTQPHALCRHGSRAGAPDERLSVPSAEGYEGL